MAMVALGAGLTVNGYAANGALEMMSGDKSSTLETKLSVPLTKKSYLFIRNRNDSDHEGKASHFTLADAGYTLGSGIDAFCEAQFNEGPMSYGTGLQYFKKSGDLSLVLVPSISLNKEKDLNYQVILKYNPSISKDLRLLTQLEVLSGFRKGERLYGIERARIGLEKKGYTLGIASDTNQTGSSNKTYSNIGGFIGIEF